MKKKILTGLAIISLLFILSGIYTITSIERTTEKLDHLIQLHQIEILREHLLLEIKRAQMDLYLKDTRYARSIDTMVTHVRSMDNVVNSCFECHHSGPVEERLRALQSRIEGFKNSLSRAFTLRANKARLRMEEDNAFRTGSGLVDEVSSITAMTSKKLAESTQSAFREVTRTKTVVYLILAFIPFLAAALALSFAKAFTGPVAELLTATRRLRSGDLDYRIGRLDHEFGEVADSFNSMADALEEDRLKMQWAEQLMVLGEMAGGLAHEIKNPLAGIKASTDVLKVDLSLSAENRAVIMKVSDQIRRIEGMLKTVLNFARPPKPQLILIDVNSVIDSAGGLAERHPAFSSRNGERITILKDFDAGMPETTADPFQLQQVFMNLFLNAADAMPDGGTITVKTSYATSVRTIQIRVSDTGKGIEPSLVDKIFQPFFTTKTAGTGLGLAIVKMLIEQHGGGIHAQNNAEGGASFLITLPLHTMSEAAEP